MPKVPCAGLGQAPCDKPAIEYHVLWTWRNGVRLPPICLYVCDLCADASRSYDRSRTKQVKTVVRYWPVVQPVVGSEEALMVEIFMHAAMRLLRAAGG